MILRAAVWQLKTKEEGRKGARRRESEREKLDNAQKQGEKGSVKGFKGKGERGRGSVKGFRV